MVNQYIPSRFALFGWLRSVAPDLRVGIALINVPIDSEKPDGDFRVVRTCFARFTVSGVFHEVSDASEDPDQQIAVVAVNAARETLGLPPLGFPDRRNELEQAVVRASLAGDADQVAFLTNQLVTNATPRRLIAATNFRTRDQW